MTFLSVYTALLSVDMALLSVYLLQCAILAACKCILTCFE